MTREITAPSVTPSDAPDESTRFIGVLAERDTLPLWAHPDPEMAYLVLDEDGQLSVAIRHASEGSALPIVFAYHVRLRWLIAKAPSEVDLTALRKALAPGGTLYWTCPDLVDTGVMRRIAAGTRLG